ncbi:dihydroneopterin aldolase [Massilia sp. YIM B02443]|uniref:dihydroneopterin aldolase n=1 Tax=Massilia sp. YIM B02443 TaxID=3050127 RepID=UPI0025B63D25|nr:dihydroneopterin aldolase [Massilia sp. YIM B02443]MDN4037917.1 dihydroneopterin aldolase [Massilia sp. YIM B02443]
MFIHPRLEHCRRLFIRDYRLDMEIGAYSHEKNKSQHVVVNIEFWVPLEWNTPISDDLDEIVNHDFVRPGIQDIISRGHINLQETLCDAIVNLVLAHPKVVAARVMTEKREVYPDCLSAGVEVFKFKE